MVKLTRDGPEGLHEWPYDEGIIKRFHFDKDEIAMLEEGRVVWRGDTAFSLDDEEA